MDKPRAKVLLYLKRGTKSPAIFCIDTLCICLHKYFSGSYSVLYSVLGSIGKVGTED